MAEAVRVIQEDEPQRLSTVHATLRGDVETIVSTALSKEKQRRYASAAALAEDLRRFLRDEPIAARPASQLYVLGKFVRRNKVVVAATAAVLLSLVGGLLASVRFGLREAVRTEEVLQLATVQDAGALLAEAEALWPVHPERIPDYRAWLEKAAGQVTLLQQNRARLEELRSLAEVQRGPGLEPSPEEAELLRQRAELDGKVTFLRRVRAQELASRQSGEDPSPEVLELASLREAAELESHERVAELQALEAAGELERSVTWHLYLEAFDLTYVKRERFGEELLGLALAHRAHELALGEPDEPLLAELVATLAWAAFVTGDIEDARRFMEQAQDLVPEARPERRYFVEGELAMLENRLLWREEKPSWGEGIENIIRKHEVERAALDELLQSPRYAFDRDDGGNAWWHAELEGLVAMLEELEAEVDAVPADAGAPDWSVQGRLAFAEQLAIDFAEGGKSFERWRAALPELEAAYPGLPIAMQVGLHEGRRPLVRAAARGGRSVPRHDGQLGRQQGALRALRAAAADGGRVGVRSPGGDRLGVVHRERRPGQGRPGRLRQPRRRLRERERGPPGWDYEAWEDGYTGYAPVDALLPNAFGLYHTIGNVSEWCEDTHVNGLYERLYSVDPVGVSDAQILRMNRGGSLADLAKNARSSKRNPGTRGTFDPYIGLRPVWAGDPRASESAPGTGATAAD